MAYGSHMSARRKTTVYLDAVEYEQLKAVARRQGRPPAELVREAVREYAERHGGTGRPRSIGRGRSGRGDLSDRAEALLAGMGRTR
jgi:Ribbon-helix-helix protein, copG family